MKDIFVGWRKRSAIVGLKGLCCIFIFVAIMFSVVLMMSLDIFQVATLCEEQEFTEGVKSALFSIVMFTWNIIGVALMFLVWHFIYKRQLIPTETRLKIKGLFKRKKK